MREAMGHAHARRLPIVLIKHRCDIAVSQSSPLALRRPMPPGSCTDQERLKHVFVAAARPSAQQLCRRGRLELPRAFQYICDVRLPYLAATCRSPCVRGLDTEHWDVLELPCPTVRTKRSCSVRFESLQNQRSAPLFDKNLTAGSHTDGVHLNRQLPSP